MNPLSEKAIRSPEIKNILVSRLRFMGDIILTTPVCHALRQSFPKAKITYLAEAPYHSLLENHPDVDEIIFLPRHGAQKQALAYGKLIRRDFDLAIDLFGNPRSALLTYLSGAGIRIGGDFRGRGIFYTHRVKDDGQRKTAVQFHLNYLKPLGIQPMPVVPFIVATEAERSWARGYLTDKGFDLGRMLVGIHPGATWPAKRWLPERFAALANRISADLGAQVLFTMGPGEEGILQAVIKESRYPASMPSVFTLRQLAAILGQLDLFIANDCGPMHLAPAVGTKTIGIFGPGEPDIWFPYNMVKGHRFVYHTVDCSLCHRDLCETMDCMKAISVDDVYNAAIDALSVKGKA